MEPQSRTRNVFRWFGFLFALFTAASCSSQRIRKNAWWLEPNSPAVVRLDNLSSRGKTVNLAVVASVETVYSPSEYRARGLEVNQWKRTIVEDLLARNEHALFAKLSHYPGFRIVDRNVTEKILQEMHFETSGSVPEALRLRLGQMLGANYILFSHCSRNSKRSGSMFHEDTITTRLIETETGAVLASQSSTR